MRLTGMLKRWWWQKKSWGTSELALYKCNIYNVYIIYLYRNSIFISLVSIPHTSPGTFSTVMPRSLSLRRKASSWHLSVLSASRVSPAKCAAWFQSNMRLLSSQVMWRELGLMPMSSLPFTVWMETQGSVRWSRSLGTCLRGAILTALFWRCWTWVISWE